MNSLKKALAIVAATAMTAVSFTTLTAGAASSTRKGVTCNDDLQGNIVFYPADIANSTEDLPIVVWANGTMCNAGMYYGLLENIAKEGYIVVANRDAMSANGKSQIKSLDWIISEDSNTKSVFYDKVDTENICFAGHSQGGRSSVNGAAADDRVDCVISLAGSSYTYEAEKCSVPTFFIGGTMDLVVPTGKWLVPAYNSVKGNAVYAAKKGAIHTTCCVTPGDYGTYLTDYLDAQLKGDIEAQAEFKAGGKLSKDSGWKDFRCK